MTISIEDRRRKGDENRLLGYDIANGTWWTLVFLPGMAKLPQVEQRKTTDPWVVSPRTAGKMADIIEAWEPTPGWFSSEADRAKEFKADFVDFLRNCNGFRTY